jgi:hypothetical protein
MQETIIYKNTVEQLQNQFIAELADRSLFVYQESIHEICQELQIDIESLHYNEEQKFGLYETDKIKLYLFRFDTLVNHFESLLSEVTGAEIIETKENLSEQKFYKEKYAAFKASLHVPPHIVRDVYNTKRDIIDVMHPGDFDAILNAALNKYAST